MNSQPVHTERSVGLAMNRYEMLDVIGDALKLREINFSAATHLRDLIRVGRVEEAEVYLRRYQDRYQ